MIISSIKIENGYLVVGFKKVKLFNLSGCNQPFKDSFFCPHKKWFMSEPCPFESKAECSMYARWCGGL